MNRLFIPLLFCAGCIETTPDYTPIGDGMKTIAVCMVCYAVVQVLGSLSKQDKP